MSPTRLACHIAVAGGFVCLVATGPLDAQIQPRSPDSRDPFDGVVSPNLYDDMGREPRTQRIDLAARDDRGLARPWLRLRRHSTGYRGRLDPFDDRRSEGRGDAGWFGGTARGAGSPLLQQPGRLGQQPAGPLPARGFVPGGVLPLRTIPDPMLQPPGRGTFGSGLRPGSGGPFGFDNNVITGSDADNTGRP